LARAGDAAEAGSVARARAKVAADVAQQVLEPGPWLAGTGDHLAAALFVESIGWSLRALDAQHAPARAQIEFEGPPRDQELGELIETHASALLEGSSASLELPRLRELALERKFEHTARPTQETQQVALLLSRVASQLLQRISPAQQAVDRLLAQRVLRTLALLASTVALVWGAARAREHLERRADLSADKPWTTSSSHQTVCHSPQRRCGGKNTYFFHTREEQDPFLQIDLLSAQRFSRVSVLNRRDCCQDRATPLVVEVSSDGANWREVSRTNQAFDEWQARFDPVTARWVRLRVARRSYLHLKDVRVLP
jgi:hypothetical protein